MEVIIEMTPFIFEDGNTYYFQIIKRESSNNWHDLYVYNKVLVKNKKRSFFGLGKEIITEEEKFIKINKSPELVDIILNTSDVKTNIRKIIVANRASHQLKDWDGFVGNIPDNIKKALKRDSSIKDILGE